MTALTTEYRAEWKCFVAYNGDLSSTLWIGEGRTPEAARSDYWSQANGYIPTASLTVDDNGEYCLYDGRKTVICGSKEAAIAFADARNWII